MENKVREILKGLFDSAYNEATFKHKDLKDTIIDQALHSIYELIEREMPKEKVIKGNVEAGLEDDFEEKMAYNQSLSDQEKILKEIFEEK